MSFPTVSSPSGQADRSSEEADLHDRVTLLTGATSWALHPYPPEGLRSIVLSDGPIGVRGIDEDDRPSAQLPSPSAWAATFDRALLGRIGALLADEARRKDVDVVLAPVVNLQRTPFGGRHFEAFSEDPYLTGELATTLIVATQSRGVGMCVKHFLGNESETERTTYIARIPSRALREVYLAPFERAVKDAHVWSVMSAYNGVDDGILSAPATEHASLIVDLLKDEWGFDGVVISDWLATNSTVESALGGLDLVMPGPDGPWGRLLEQAVDDGAVPRDVIDDKVRRIVRLGQRVGALEAGEPRARPSEDLPVAASTRELLRETVARSSVVLRNTGVLPLATDRVGSIAVIGPNAVAPFVQGGGSASVTPPLLVSPVEGIRETFPASEISVHRGTSGRAFPPPIDPALVTTPSGEAGYRVTYLDGAGARIGDPHVVDAGEGWNRNPPIEAREAIIEAQIALEMPGAHRLQVGLRGAHRLLVNGQLESESFVRADHDVILDSSANHPDGPVIDLETDAPRVVQIVSRQQVIDAAAYGRFVRFVLRHEVRHQSASAELDEAIAAAERADVAIVIIGTNEESESEGWDRSTLALPGAQDELVERVLAANPRTIVVVNAGAPVILPWIERAPAVLWWWLPGQEAGAGLAAALSGAIEPSGRLPWTLPSAQTDVPVFSTRPVAGVVDYAEGIHVGHREWDRLGLDPAREFGFGLGYGSWLYEELTVAGPLDHLEAEVTVTNTSVHDSREVVQVYAEAPESPVERPVRWLAGFTTVDVPAGQTRRARVSIPRRCFEVWNPDTEQWWIPSGPYLLRVGRSSRDLRLTTVIDLTNGVPTIHP